MSGDTSASVATGWKHVRDLDVSVRNPTTARHAMFGRVLLLTATGPHFVGGVVRLRATEMQDETGHYWRGYMRRFIIRGTSFADILRTDELVGQPFPWRFHYKHDLPDGPVLESVAWEYDATVTKYVSPVACAGDSLFHETLFWRADGARYIAPFEG